MNSQHPPCSCQEETTQSNPGVALEQNSQDFCPSCPSQASPGVASGKSRADPAKTPRSSMEEPVTFETPGMCVMRFPLQKSILTVELCPSDACLDNLEKISMEKVSPEMPAAAPEPCRLEVVDLGADEPCQAWAVIPGDPCVPQTGISVDPCASQTGISADPCVPQIGISTDPCASQIGISMDPCTSQTGISVDPCAPQIGISMDPCTSQTGISVDPCGPQTGISTDPCAPQTGISCSSQSQGIADPCASQIGIPTDPCAPQSQGITDPADAGASQASPRRPFRLNSCTSSIVERCLSRCQSWFRARK